MRINYSILETTIYIFRNIYIAVVIVYIS